MDYQIIIAFDVATNYRFWMAGNNYLSDVKIEKDAVSDLVDLLDLAVGYETCFLPFGHWCTGGSTVDYARQEAMRLLKKVNAYCAPSKESISATSVRLVFRLIEEANFEEHLFTSYHVADAETWADKLIEMGKITWNYPTCLDPKVPFEYPL